MNLIQNKPHQVIWSIIPIILILGIAGINRALDIQMHDTYFVIAAIHIGIFLSILLGIIGFLYWIFKERKLVNWMTITHVFLTIITFVSLILTAILFQSMMKPDFEMFKMIQNFVFVLLFFIVISQFIFVGNLFFSFFAKNK